MEVWVLKKMGGWDGHLRWRSLESVVSEILLSEWFVVVSESYFSCKAQHA